MKPHDARKRTRKLGPSQRSVLLFFMSNPESWHPLRDIGQAKDIQKATISLAASFLESTTVGTLREDGFSESWIRDSHFRPDAPAYRLAQNSVDIALRTVRDLVDEFLATTSWSEFVLTRAFQVYLQYRGLDHISNLMGRFALGLRRKLDREVMRRYLGNSYEADLVAKATLEGLSSSNSMAEFWPLWENRLRDVGIRPAHVYLALCFARWRHLIDLLYRFRTCPTAIGQSFRDEPILFKPLEAWVQHGDASPSREPTDFVYAWCQYRILHWWQDDCLRDEHLQERLNGLFPSGGVVEERITERRGKKGLDIEYYMRWKILPAVQEAVVEIDPRTGTPIIRLRKEQ